MRIAACQYLIERFADWDSYSEHLTTLCRQVAEEGATLLVLPEYASMAITGLQDDHLCGDLHASIAAMQPMLGRWFAFWEKLANELGVYITPGSIPVKDWDGHYRNRTWLFGPEGSLGSQDKLIMTRFEREEWNIAGGAGLRVFRLPECTLGILICYDNEFPQLARQLTEMGADIILAPSCTDTEAGYYRVRVGCQARALENQIAVVQSPIVGTANWSPAVDINVGRAGVFVPPDYGMPANGVLGESLSLMPDTSTWLMVDLDLEALREVRKTGQVMTRRDWPEQFDPARCFPLDI
ncbi:carbon-nitrogen hydrolase family protein [Pokkaliibacter sp. CJK22405]|uniref:carbon-nitrogen hydrolase family protein n=1 Tax=Pokkaliibacter sp. CJK22405 TaxID=3384615 RepID=UPI00398486CC